MILHCLCTHKHELVPLFRSSFWKWISAFKLTVTYIKHWHLIMHQCFKSDITKNYNLIQNFLSRKLYFKQEDLSKTEFWFGIFHNCILVSCLSGFFIFLYFDTMRYIREETQVSLSIIRHVKSLIDPLVADKMWKKIIYDATMNEFFFIINFFHIS